jgi:hypothetical protein
LYLRRAHERDGETRQAGHIRVFRWRFRCVERVYLASQSGHCFVWGREGMLPPWRRILEDMLADLAREAALWTLASSRPATLTVVTVMAGVGIGAGPGGPG